MSALALFCGLFLIYNHWFADFLLQTEDMATKKSTSNYWLFRHVAAYTIGMLPSSIMVTLMNLQNPFLGVLWLFINCLLHYATDYGTSRWTSKLYANKQFYSPNKYLKFINFPAFFSVIGFDQCIHYTCLFVSFCILT